MPNSFARRTLAALALACSAFGAAQAQDVIKIAGVYELSGAGATAGTNFKNGVELAVKEINAAGGILGKKIECTQADTQSQPGVAKGLAAKAVDDGAFAVIGPVFSGSIMVSMAETRKAEIPNLTGGEAASITRRATRTCSAPRSRRPAAMPKVARYIATSSRPRRVAVVYVEQRVRQGRARRDRQAAGRRPDSRSSADVSTDQGQVDFSAAVLKAKQRNADALFVYLNEEESARALRELRKQGYDKPIIGETVLISQKVIELAGDAANGATGARRPDDRCAEP